MRLSDPIPCTAVVPGMVVMLWGTPRSVIALAPEIVAQYGPGYAACYVEGMNGVVVFSPGETTQLVFLEPADALAIMAQADLNPEIISRTTMGTERS